MIYRLYILIPLTLLQSLCFGQDAMISGIVIDAHGEKLPGVTVQINELNRGSVTDHVGHYTFPNLKSGNYTITASFIGFQKYNQRFTIKDRKPISINITLKEAVTQLNEVTVMAKSESQELHESVASVAVLETKKLYAQSNNTSDVIKQISGVNVRQTGGFGSSADVYINGMSGKQVKFFLDGIPLSYYGSGLGLNVLPVNLMEQIEVYKGVVPVDLGADALGGAINIKSRKEYINYLDASYSLGSFNTHKVNFNGQYVNTENHLIAGVNSFYNHSDNNYKVDIEIPDQYGNPVPATVRRFHDQFTNYLVNAYAGVYDKKYADRLVFSVRYSGLYDDIQHNAVMAQPYGQVAYDESTLGFSANYEKEEILPRIALKWYGGVNMTSGNFVDTTLNAYTWDGEIYDRRTDGGEITTSRNLLSLHSRNAVSRLNLHHNPWEKGQFTLNVFSSRFNRYGKDPIAAEFYGEDFYANPTTLIKNATGLAYEHAFSTALVSYTGVKHFYMMADGYAIQNMEFQPNKQTVSNFGVSQSLRYRFFRDFLAKASYEYATRLPDETELFGDFTLVRPNPFLNPEQSHNANLGFQFNTQKLKVELNTFYRLTDNIIWLRTSQFFAQYQNLLKALVKGLDVEVQYQPFDFIRLKANATYQDIRNRSSRSVTGSVDNRYYDARLPNIPYLFGNGEVRYQKFDFLGTNSRFSAWWSASYVHEFYLYWAVDGNKDLKNTIPSQFIQNIGVSYALPADRFSVSLESTNLFDQKAFDNFSVQRPGRALYVTLRTYLH
ncbi:cobalamin receptor protein [Reichenbachiella sp. MSK19-1]|nr:cobalamin receptor protein [Reichenbachiella sp. MSK19-1]